MSLTKSTGWRDTLDRAASKARAEVIGHRRIEHAQHGLLVATALDAFGDDPRAVFFIEAVSPAANIPRPDLILMHPEVGVLVIENKGLRLDDLHEARGTALVLLRDGRLKEEDPFAQSEKVVLRLKDLARRRANLAEGLFLNTAALPLINRAEFAKRFEVHWPEETLFADACSNPEAFKTQVMAFAQRCQKAAGKTQRLSKHVQKVVTDVLMGRGVFYAPRSVHVESTDSHLLGVQIQELEVGIKEPTPQQKELGKADLRGSHRLFRGVAGSGKSIMLALNAAHTLLKLREERSGLFAGSATPPRVLVVCFNKTLVHYLRQKIEDRYVRQAWDAPAEGSLTVTHFEGLIKILEEGAPTLKTGLNFEQKEERARAVSAAWDALDEPAREALRFDAVYLDEAQDLHAAEIELLLRLARRDGRGGQTFVVFYDNAQNIYGHSAPVWQQLGVDIVGRTVYLDQCLRNTTQTLDLAFNVLVGSFAPEDQRVSTRTFADVASLRQRGLITESGDRFEIHFSPRAGPAPQVQVYASGREEIEGVVAAIQRLVTQERVVPSDILVLYKSPHSFKNALADRLREALGGADRVRVVDQLHRASKSSALIEDGVLTVSTIASAKGYDAPVVFLLGADELAADSQGRASFYVGATRAKLCLFISGVKKSGPTLLDEIVRASAALAPSPVLATPPIPPSSVAPNPPVPKKAPLASLPPVKVGAAPAGMTPPVPKPAPPRCRHCRGEALHAQHGRFGYYFKCIDCDKHTPIDKACSRCGKEAKIRKQKLEFFRDCKPCELSQLIHTNVDLETLEEPE